MMPVMAATLLTELPENFAAGTTVEYTKSFANYPANQSWTAVLYLAGRDVGKFTGTPTGPAFAFAIDATTSGNLRPGVYAWREIVTNAGKSYVAASGTCEIFPNIGSAVAGDLQSFEEKMLAAIEIV